jgi:hypothetical protein
MSSGRESNDSAAGRDTARELSSLVAIGCNGKSVMGSYSKSLLCVMMALGKQTGTGRMQFLKAASISPTVLSKGNEEWSEV